jgi:hypothetical protein
MSKTQLQVEDIRGWRQHFAGEMYTPYPCYMMILCEGGIRVEEFNNDSELRKYRKMLVSSRTGTPSVSLIATAPVPDEKISYEFLGKHLINKYGYCQYASRCIGFTVGGDCIMEDGEVWEQKDCAVTIPDTLYYYNTQKKGHLDYIELRFDRG